MTTTSKPLTRPNPRSRSQVTAWVLLILVAHWFCMHLVATRWMRETQLTLDVGHATYSQSYVHASEPNAEIAADRWRHTAAGWEILPVEDQPTVFAFGAPSQHIALAQIWPAAWAACLALSVVALTSLISPK